jgi:hypothetical protein
MPPSPRNPTPQILPRQPGETDYAYRKRRSIALTGETPYQRRIRAARARGLTTQEARGHRANEAQIRRERTIAQTGLTPWQFWKDNQVTWLTNNGFTPQSTGWSWNRLVRIAPRLRYMNDVSSPGAQITPEMMAGAIDQEDAGLLPSEWTWERMNEKYEAIYEFHEHNNPQPGRTYWFRDRDPEMEVAWWYYR